MPQGRYFSRPVSANAEYRVARPLFHRTVLAASGPLSCTAPSSSDMVRLFDRARSFGFRLTDGRARNGKIMTMLNRLSVLLTALAVIAAADAAMAQSADLSTVSPKESAGLEYRQGAFYYGSDCGGN